ncbi:hypothetical protein QCO44_09060 [Selenomonas sputigena]|uniref:Uncharacterized protein n=1 Tax=Selenomonas sputigena TaxID=69823 RepID=A0ABV3X8G1_9FIRM
MFEWIGKISDYTSMWRLKKEANYRIRTGQAISLRDGKQQIAEEARQRRPQSAGTLTKVTDTTRLAIISQKARSGKKLTPEELRLLKENDDALYQKAKKADDAREELKAALKRAKTKEAARRILMEAQLKVAIEALSGSDAAGLSPAAANAGGAASGEAGAAAAADGASAPAGGASSFSDGAAPAALAGTGEAAAANAAPAANAADAASVQEAPSGAAGAQTAGAESAAAKDGAHDGKAHDAVGEKKPSFLEERLAALKASYNRAMDELENAKNAKCDFDDTYIIVLRALADEWREFTSSKAWEKLPENEREAKLRGANGRVNNYGRQGVDVLLSMADSYKIAGKTEMPTLIDLLAGGAAPTSPAPVRSPGSVDRRL